MPRPVSLNDFSDTTFVSDPALSPDGRFAAWTEVNFDLNTDRSNQVIWIADTKAGTTRPFTSGTRARSAQFSPDSTQLLFIANRGAGSLIHVAPIDGGEGQPLATRASPSAIAWSPDGTQLAYVAAVSDANETRRHAPTVITDVYFQADGSGQLDNSRRHLFVYSLLTGVETQVTRGDWHAGNPIWSVDGSRLFFVANRTRQRWNSFHCAAIWEVELASGKTRRLTPARGDVLQICQQANGRLVYSGHLEGGLSGVHRHLLSVDPSRPDDIRTELASPAVTPSHMATRGTSLAVTSTGDIYFLAGVKGACHLHRLRSGKVTRITREDQQVTGFALQEKGNALLYASLWTDRAAEVFLHRPGTRASTRQVSRANARQLHSLATVNGERWHYQHPDGTPLEMFILKPPGFRVGKRYPLWLTIHGGPHGMHPALDHPMMYQIQAALGYVVMLPNPRGSVSYGEAFMQACKKDWGGGDYEDIMLGVDTLLDAGIIDSDRLYVEGYSYGGIMTSWIVGHTDRFRAAVIGAPVVDQVSNFGTDDEPHFSVESMGGTPQQIPDEYRFRSALTYVDKVTTPVQLQHYEGDLRCPIQQSMQYFMALKFLGQEVEFVRYPGGSHTGRTPGQWQDMLERMHDWWQRHP